MGEEYFYSCEDYEYLHDIDIPHFFSFEFNTFMELYNLSGEDGLKWSEIESYCNIRKVKLSQSEINVILKINSWANQTINELRDEED